ncbi:MAG: hypothetical protein LIO96_13435, partial [Lachnospiraceae bacterium]|nr:hypothetical protein [Lachnospiraceae bacterium]
MNNYGKISCINPDILPPHLLSKIGQLIKSYCCLSNFTQKRAPLFCTPGAELNTYSLLSPLIESIVNPNPSKNGNIPLANEEFKLQHQRNIFQYILKK